MRSALLLPLLLTVFTAVGQDDPDNTINVVSWNIRYDNAHDSLDRWEKRRGTIASEVSRQHPHIVGLQEVLAHQLAYLEAQWPAMRHFGVGREDGIAKGEFSPVFYDPGVLTFVRGRTIWLSETPDRPSKGWDAACERIATYVVLIDDRSGDSIHVMNTHWDHIGKQARLQSARMVHDLLAPALARKQHVVLLGDFNATPDQASLSALGRFLTNCAPPEHASEGTFNGFDTVRTTYDRIDHVFLSPDNWQVLHYQVPHPMINGRHASDHFPVVVRMHPY